MDAQRAAFRAFTAGYVSVDDQHIFPLDVGSRAAIETAVLHGGPPEMLFEAGRRQAQRLALHRARMRLWTKHNRAVAAAASQLHVDTVSLAQQLLLTADQPRERRRAQAVGTLTAALFRQPDVHDQWAAANAAAYQAAVGRGRAEAKATPAGGGPADIRLAGQLTRTEAEAVDAQHATSVGFSWIQKQLQGLGGNLADLAARGELPNADELAKEVQTAINAAEGPQWWAEEQMVGEWASSFVAAATADNPDRRLYWWTSEDDRVCPTCDLYEGDNPYTDATIPACPAHPLCRCDIEAG